MYSRNGPSKDCAPQILRGLFLNSVTHIHWYEVSIRVFQGLSPNFASNIKQINFYSPGSHQKTIDFWWKKSQAKESKFFVRYYVLYAGSKDI